MAKIIIHRSRWVRASSSVLFVLKRSLRGRRRGVGVFRRSKEKKLAGPGYNPFYQLADLAPFIRGGSNQNDKRRAKGA
jgi:hypothetical protein